MADIYTPIMTTPDPDQIRDFTIPMASKQFRIDDDVFKAPALMSPIAMKKLAGLHAELGDIGSLTNDIERAVGITADLFTVLLPGPSGRRFKERLLSEGRPADPEADPPTEADPPVIDLVQQAIPALYWLLEQYGLRPTEPSSPSPTGSTDGQTGTLNGGISSTDGAWPTVSITGASTSPTG